MNEKCASIDDLRQKSFNLYKSWFGRDELIRDFFQTAHNYLEKDLDYDTASELFTELTRFSPDIPDKSSFLPEFLNKSKSNANYIYITSSILFELIYNGYGIDTQSYQSFVDDSLKEVIHNLSNDNDKMIIFGHQIQPQFVNNLILNLFYISDLTKEIFSAIFPHIFLRNFELNNQKFEIILQKSLQSGYLQLTDASNTDLFEILTHDLNFSNNKVDEKSILFFSMVIIFTINGGEIEINGLSTENVVPFTALTILYHKKHQPIKKLTFSKIKNLLLNSLNEKMNSPVFNCSIDVILNNLEYLFDQDLIEPNSILQIVMILLKKLMNKEFFGNIYLLLSIFFNYSNYDLDVQFKKFIDSIQTDLFNLIFHRLSEDECNIHYSLNLEIFDSNLLIEHVKKLINTDEIIKTLHIIDNYCTNVPDLSLLSDSLQQVFYENVENKKWNDVLFLNNFMKKHNIQIDLQKIKEISIPKTVNHHLYESIQNIDENDDIDDIIAYLLMDSHSEDNQNFKILFIKMLKDKAIYHNFIVYSSYLLNSTNLQIPSYLKLFINEYEQNPDDFMNIVNSFYVFDVQKNALIIDSSYSLSLLPNPDFGFSIVFKLFESINEKFNDNYSAFLCLKNIAKYFPFLFKDTQLLFNIALQQLDSFHLIFEQNLNEKSINLLKSGYLALYTILLSLNLPFIFDSFLDWLFNNILSFSNSQVFGFFLILLQINDPNKLMFMHSKIVNFNFNETCKIFFEREIQNKTFQFYFKKNICEFISKVYTNIIKSIYTEKDESKYIIECSIIENVYTKNIICMYNQICSKLKSGLKIATFNFITDSEYLSKPIADFIFKINITKDENKDPTELQINDFKSKIIKINDISCISEGKNGQTQNNTITKTNKRKLKIVKKKNNQKGIISENVDHLLIPIFKNILNILSCHSLDYKYNTVLYNIFNLFNEEDDYFIIISNLFCQYLKEFSSNEIGSESFSSLRSMHQLFNIFEKITEFKIEDKDIFYPYIDDILNILMLPKWRLDSSLILKVSFLLTRLCVLPIKATQLIINRDTKKRFNRVINHNAYKYYRILKVIERFEKNNESSSHCKFPGNVGIKNINTLYHYIVIDNNHYAYELNNNIEEEIEYEKVYILYQYLDTIQYFFSNFSHLNKIESTSDTLEKISLRSVIKTCHYARVFNKHALATYIVSDLSISSKPEINVKWFLYLILKKGTELGNINFSFTYYNFIVNNESFFFNKEKSYKYLRRAADAGFNEALIQLCKLLSNKHNIYNLPNKSKYFQKIMNKSPDYKYEYGVSLVEEGNIEEGKRLITEAANYGCLMAVSYVHYEYRKKHGLLENTPEVFENEAKKYKQILLDYKEDNNKVFVDETFPHFKYWKRIDEIYDAPLFQKDLIDPSFIKQGQLGDCYLISSFARIAKQYYLVPLLFERKLHNSILGHVKNSINIKCGAVVVYFQAFGRKLPVLIDTYVPFTKNGELIGSRPSDKSKSPWFSLVEKAFAKLNGSYLNISGGYFYASIYSLFFYHPIRNNEIPSFDYLMEKQKDGCIMQLTIKNTSKSDVKLHSNHSYLILKARSYKGINLILILNPWGKTKYEGKYSKFSDEWTPELKEAFNYDYYPEGVSWMTHEEVTKYFTNFCCVQPINPEYHIKMAHCKLGTTSEDDEKSNKGFIINIKDNIPSDEEIQFYFIVERRNSVFTNSYEDKKGKFFLIVIDNQMETNRVCFNGATYCSAFEFKIKNTKSIRIKILRQDKNESDINFYINIICKPKFEVTDDAGSDSCIRSINNPGIVFENYTLSNPEISKKLKLKIFDKKFILSLDDEDEKTSDLSYERDEQIEKLFNYVNKDFSSSYINLNELFTFDKSLIGSGTYSSVFIVNDKKTNKQYAAKILKYSINEIPAQFLNELTILRSLRHPSIVKFIGFSDKNFQNENYPTIITEYLKNGSLINLLKDVHEGIKELNNTKKMMILIGIALGIEYLHNHGIIHCDLKLENILLDDNLNPKICDFGNSKPLSLNANDNIGTPLYMAPEVINGQPHSFQSDVFSFGVIAYYIYTNQIPNVNEPIIISDSINKSTFLKELMDENPENRPTFQQIVSLLLTKREKTWLENVNEDEIEKYLHVFGLTNKAPKIDFDFIRSIDVDKYPENANQPKMTINEIMSNDSISSSIKNDLQSAENYLKTKVKNEIDHKQIRKLLFNVGYQFCMGDKEATKNIQEDYFYAIKYLKEAALLGHKTSLYILATLFSNNESNDNQETLKIAMKLAEIAADMGSPEAFNLLAVFYKNGVSVRSNIIMAAIYFKIAADRGVVSSMFQFANIMMQIGNEEIESDEFNKQLKIAENIIQSIEGKSNKVYKEIRYTLEAIENKDVALFVSSKYFEKAAQNGNEEAENVLKKINEGLGDNQDHPEFYDDLTQSLSIDPTVSLDY